MDGSGFDASGFRHLALGIAAGVGLSALILAVAVGSAICFVFGLGVP